MFLSTISRSVLRPVLGVMTPQYPVPLPVKLLKNTKFENNNFLSLHGKERDCTGGPCKLPRNIEKSIMNRKVNVPNKGSTKFFDTFKKYELKSIIEPKKKVAGDISPNLRYLMKMGQSMKKCETSPPQTAVVYMNNVFLRNKSSSHSLLRTKPVQQISQRQKSDGKCFPSMKCLPKNWERHPDDCRPCCCYPSPPKKRVRHDSTVDDCPCEPYRPSRKLHFRPPCGPGSKPIYRRIPKCCPNLRNLNAKPCVPKELPKPFCKATRVKCVEKVCPEPCHPKNLMECPNKNLPKCCPPPSKRKKHRTVMDPQPPCYYPRKLSKPACIGCGQTCLPPKKTCLSAQCTTTAKRHNPTKIQSSLFPISKVRKSPRNFALSPTSLPTLLRRKPVKSFAEAILDECNFKLLTSRIIESEEDFPAAKGYFQKLSVTSMAESKTSVSKPAKKHEPALVLFKRSLFDRGVLRRKPVENSTNEFETINSILKRNLN